MPTITLTRGIQASGKSSWAKAWVIEDPDNRVRVNRDDLRGMLYAAEGKLLPWAQEQQITAVEAAIAKAALDAGKDVVVDAMHLKAAYVKRWFKLGYPVKFKDFWVDLEDALDRNADRGLPLPQAAIVKTYNRFCKAGVLPVPPKQESERVTKYEKNWALPTAWIFDVDGTLAHIRPGGRSPYDFSRVREDLLDHDVARLLGELEEAHNIIILSGRDDSCRADTEAWLIDNNIRYDHLHMRRTGDTRRDSVVKAEIFDTHIRGQFNVLGVVDDRDQVVRMWRQMGLKCFQAQEGAF